MNFVSLALLIGVPSAFLLLSKSAGASQPPKPNPGNGGGGPGPVLPGDWTPGAGDTLPKTGKYPFIETLPEIKPGDSQQTAGAKLVRRGQMIRDEIARLAGADELSSDNIDWTHVFSSSGQYAAKIPVMKDAFKIDGIRVDTSFRDAQNIADILGIYLLTPKVSDLIQQASLVKVKPNAHEAWMKDGTGSYTRRMVDHSLGVDAMIEAVTIPSPTWPREPGYAEGLLNNPGKYWINTTQNWVRLPTHRPGMIYGANFGWYDPSAPNKRIWQNVGLFHDISHVDYSQVFRAMGPEIEITDGVSGEVFKLPTAEVLTSPKWAPLVSNEGPLPLARHPKIAPYIIAA